ncbi:ATPase [Effusibacillus lacus]|uniref:ATPase n=1 Tax=Effusibacillus lacus TaxID=1348429 RepID=A0A292YPH9_9BACL|nr:ATPase [Effusibacillus lacus]
MSGSRNANWMVFVRSRGEAIAAGVSGLLLVAAWLLERADFNGANLLFLLAFVIGGAAKTREGLLTLIKEREIDVNLLMLFAACGAASIGYWMEGAILIFIFAVSGALEKYTMARSYRDLSALIEMKPETALLYQCGREIPVPADQVRIGDLIIAKPGDRIAADGIVREGVSSVNQAAITGESIPVDKEPGHEVFAGTLNGSGSLLIEVTRTNESSMFAKIIKLVQAAQNEVPPTQQFVKRFERIYAKTVIALTLIFIMVPPFLLGWSLNQSLYKAMVFLVVSSPCALMASIMPATLSAISSAARKGILFKGGGCLEQVSRIRAIALDKTGTLTTGRLQITDIIPFQGYDQRRILEIAASIESMSEHPIAKSIVEKALEQQLTLIRPSQLQAITGKGVIANYQGEAWRIGKPAFLNDTDVSPESGRIMERLAGEGKTVIVIENQKGLAGILAVQDSIRHQSREMIDRLRKMGIHSVMLTGDRRSTAEAIAAKAGIDSVYADLLPQEKVGKVKELMQTYGEIAMVGDGINDAPALATATVGIAMGEAGSDASLETADVVLMNDDIGKIPAAIELGKRTQKIIKQNIIFSIFVIILLILSNFTQGLPLPLGVIGHEGSTLLVILNGLRLLR